MRKQIYKAKQINTYEWIYGSLLYLNGIPYIVPDDGDINNLTQYKVEETTICEHTGLYNHGEEDIWEHDYVKIPYDYCNGTDDDVYEVRKEYDCPGGGWAQSGFVLDKVGWCDFMSFEDTIDDYSNEICLQIVGNKYDDFNV